MKGSKLILLGALGIGGFLLLRPLIRKQLEGFAHSQGRGISPATPAAKYASYGGFSSIGYGKQNWNNSEVWDIRDRKDRNDDILDNRMPPYKRTAISEWNPNRLHFIGSRAFDCDASTGVDGWKQSSS